MRLIGILLMLVLLMPSAASAHIVNDQNLYEDIEYSTAKTEIVYLNGLGILVPDHGNALFSPKDKLQRVDLAYLTGRFHKAAASNASPDEVAAAAVEKGYVPSLVGNATYGDVNQAFFSGQLSVENPEGELTREEFALFMYNHLNDQVDGKSLYERAGFVPGPTGEIEKVNAGEKTPILQIAGKEYTLSEHPRILHASADPATWQGKRVEESWAVAVDGTLHLIVFDAAASSATDAAVPTSAASQAAGSHTGAGHEHHEHEEEGSSFPVVPVVLAVILLSIVGTFWVSRKKSN